MSATRAEGFKIERVVVALDAGCRDAETLATAVEVAGRFGAEIAGLFVEDENMIRLCSSPIARHVAVGAGGSCPPDIGELERELRRLAAEAEAALGASAKKLGLPWSFSVRRGFPAAMLGEATLARDLLVAGETRSWAGFALPFASPLVEAVKKSTLSALHVARRAALTRPLVVGVANSALFSRTIAAASRLVGGSAGEFDVALVGDAAEVEKAAAAARDALGPQGYRFRLRALRSAQAAELARLYVDAAYDLLVIAADFPLAGDGEELHAAVRRSGGALLIVR